MPCVTESDPEKKILNNIIWTQKMDTSDFMSLIVAAIDDGAYVVPHWKQSVRLLSSKLLQELLDANVQTRRSLMKFLPIEMPQKYHLDT